MQISDAKTEALKEERKKVKHRLDWERNHFALTEAYLKIVKETGKHPTIKALREITGFSYRIIANHLQELDLQKVVGGSAHKLLANNVVMGLASKGAKGDAFAAKLYFQLVFDYVEKTKIDHTTNEKDIVPGDNYTDEEKAAIADLIDRKRTGGGDGNNANTVA